MVLAWGIHNFVFSVLRTELRGNTINTIYRVGSILTKRREI